MIRNELTLPKIRGIQFEIWLELLLKQNAYQNVLRDVEFHKERFVYRQADLTYNIVKDNELYLAVVEAKFSANGPVPYLLRDGEKKKAGQTITRIDNVVDEVYERQRFIGADLSILTTNHKFEDRVRRMAPKRNILIVEGTTLDKYFTSEIPNESIDDSIRKITIKEHRLNKNVIYI